MASRIADFPSKRRLSTRLLLLCLLCLSMKAQTPAAFRLYPVDDTARDSAFRSYTRKLRSAVDKHDTGALRKLVDDEVVVGPRDTDKGWESFKAKWHPDDKENSRLWDALADLLSLGFTQEHPSLFLSPYLVWRFPRELDMRTHLVVIRDNTVLRESPSARAASAGSVSFDIVERLGRAQKTEDMSEWIPVRTLDGKTGYLDTRTVRSPLMPRAQFGIRRGRWMLVALEGAFD